MPKTVAEQQIELLKKMKDSRLRRKLDGDGLSGKDASVTLASGRVPRAAAAMPSLPLGRATWHRLALRQRETHEFKSKKEMGEWAAQLLLALPTASHRLDAEAREDLFHCMQAWCAARGPQ